MAMRSKLLESVPDDQVDSLAQVMDEKMLMADEKKAAVAAAKKPKQAPVDVKDNSVKIAELKAAAKKPKQAPVDVKDNSVKIAELKAVDIDSKEVEQLFLGDEVLLDGHVKALRADPMLYCSQLHTIVDRKLGESLTSSVRSRVLAACFITKQKNMVQYLLSDRALIGVGEVVKALQLLDAPRRLRQYKKKLAQLETAKQLDDKSVRRTTIANLKTKIHNLEKELCEESSLSGAASKALRRWAASIPTATLEFYLLNYPTEPWRLLADLVHFHPKDFALPYFLDVVFGKEPPADCLYAAAKGVTPANVVQLLTKYPALCECYSFLRKALKDNSEAKAAREGKIQAVMEMGFDRHSAYVGSQHAHDTQAIVEWIVENAQAIANAAPEPRDDTLPVAARAILASKAPLETVIWWYHEIECKEAEKIMAKRLEKGEAMVSVNAKANYGKLMERLLYFREKQYAFTNLLIPYAQAEMKNLTVKGMDALKIAVLGDASGSMEVAIKSATIIGSLLSIALDAELSFFNDRSIVPPVVPRSVTDVIKVVDTIKARGGTSMAAALRPYYTQKKPMDLFVLVSDEGENVASEGLMFAQLFAQYRQEVAPRAKVFLVSFLAVGVPGTINERLQAVGIQAKQFRFDPQRPDTSKFDTLLGHISLETTLISEFNKTVRATLGEAGVDRDSAKIIADY